MKPKFNPNQPFEVVGKPKFDPSQPFEEVSSEEPPQEEVPEESGITARGLLKGTLEALPIAGGIGGGFLGTAAGPLGTVGGAGAGAYAGTALKNLGEKYLLGEDKTREDIYLEPVKEGLMSAAGEGAGQLIGKGLSKVGQTSLVKKGIEKAAEGLESFAQAKAVKQSGAMLKDFRKLFDKNKIADIGNEILNAEVQTPNGVKKLMQIGDNVESIAEKSSALKEQTGKEIQNIYKSVDDRLTDPEFLKNIKPEKLAKINAVERFNPQTDADEMLNVIKNEYKNKIGGQKIIDRASEIVGDIKKRGNTLQDALSTKNELDALINYQKRTAELPELDKALIKMRNIIRDKTNSYLTELSKHMDVGDIVAANKKYGAISEIADMANDKMARESANRMFSPSDYMAGAAGTISSGPVGIASAIANKIARERGAGLLAKGASAASKGLKSGLPGRGLLGPAGQGLIRGRRNE